MHVTTKVCVACGGPIREVERGRPRKRCTRCSPSDVVDSWRKWRPEAKAELRWRLTARPDQLPPDGDWFVWLLLAGRGYGKTRTGAEWVRRLATRDAVRVAVVAPTYADARDTCVEGESGLLSVLPKSLVRAWNRSLGELELANGSHVKLFSADTPDRLRGPQHHHAWCDELAAWEYPETWDQLMFGLRLGERPRVVVTTTPKPTKIIKELNERSDVHVTKGSTFDNAANLAPSALEQLRLRYEGTRLGRQELMAEILDDVEGALWTRQQMDECVVHEAPPLKRVVVGVDPSGGVAETGIVVCGLGRDGKGYVLADLTASGSPADWGRRVVEAYRGWDADRVVAERNFGGDMVEHTIRTVDRNVSLKVVSASRGKVPRAEPVSALYEQGRVHHVGRFPKLEDQMCTYTAEDKVSPDRMDAMVWALTELMVTGSQKDKFVSPGGTTGQSYWRG